MHPITKRTSLRKRYNKKPLVYIMRNGKLHRVTPEEAGKEMAERTLAKARKSAQQAVQADAANGAAHQTNQGAA